MFYYVLPETFILVCHSFLLVCKFTGEEGKENMHTRRMTGRRNWIIYWAEMWCTGTEFVVDGQLMEFPDVLRCVVMENSPYMADYVPGDHGTIRQIRFDRIGD